nr:ATP-binding cassette domain-containing protein [uncultured Rhodopila sp.]
MKSRLITLLQQETTINLRSLYLGFLIIGISNALVLLFVHDATTGTTDATDLRTVLMFVATVVVFAATKRNITISLTEHVQDAVSRLRIRLINRIQYTRLQAFEALDRAQLINAVSENSAVIMEGARHYGQGVPAGIMLVASFIYIAYLSLPALYLVVVCVAACAWVVLHLNRSIGADMRTSIQREDEFLKSFQQLMDGFQELKMDHLMSRDLFDNYLRKSSLEARVLNTNTAISIVESEIYTYIFFYILLGGILFVLPRISDITPTNTLSVTTILLFLLGNGTVFVQALPNITKTDTAIDNMLSLAAALDDLEAPPESLPPNPWRGGVRGELRAVDLYFRYPGPEETAFSVQLDNVTIPGNELLFLLGGNGSGKSTFMKLLAGLYRPTHGRLQLDNIPVSPENVQHYRECFGVVFADFHLFDRLYGHPEVDESRVAALLREMQLEDKTQYAGRRFTNLNLSTGQRKRLALATALLEDRPIYLFDEVAADQDPEFRRYFYEGILRNLKARGKTVVVVSHDDRYFGIADRVLKLDYGRLVNA